MALRYAVFVDAGYLYAQGSKALSGQKLRRERVDLKLPEIIEKLRVAAQSRASSASLLRIYWYDGLVKGRLSAQQEKLSFLDDVKLRLGIVTPTGQQKGVDSLIVTDLVELARNRAITDAIVLSGDEDLRIGVQLAQSFGVRIHLLGIAPSRGSQSLTLLQESDTTTEWSQDDIDEFLSLRQGSVVHESLPRMIKPSADVPDPESAIGVVIEGFAGSLSPEELVDVDNLAASSPIPRVIDSRLLASCRTALGRDLDLGERSVMRKRFQEAATARLKDH